MGAISRKRNSRRLCKELQHCCALTVLTVIVVLALVPSGLARQRRHLQKKANRATPIEPERVQKAQAKLAELGYWVGDDKAVGGVGFRNALIAFQKIGGLKRTGKLSEADLEVMSSATTPAPKATGFPHIEVDLTHQVLFFVSTDGKVSGILPISSGSGKPFTSEGWTRDAITPTGRFTIRRKIAGWRKSPLGLLYYPNYFMDGVAIHGNPSVPVVAASHGCIRIPMFAAKDFFKMATVGTIVLVYGDNGAKTATNRSLGKPADPLAVLPNK